MSGKERIYGKIFETMFTGSLCGSGAVVISVMSYVIAYTKQSRVELNPKVLAALIGASVKEIDGAIRFLSAPDPESRLKDHKGCRLVKEGGFQYFVVGWEKYQKIKSEIDRRESNRASQQRSRAKKRAAGNGPLNGEAEAIAAVERGEMTQEEADDMAASTREGI